MTAPSICLSRHNLGPDRAAFDKKVAEVKSTDDASALEAHINAAQILLEQSISQRNALVQDLQEREKNEGFAIDWNSIAKTVDILGVGDILTNPPENEDTNHAYRSDQPGSDGAPPLDAISAGEKRTTEKRRGIRERDASGGESSARGNSESDATRVPSPRGRRGRATDLHLTARGTHRRLGIGGTGTDGSRLPGNDGSRGASGANDAGRLVSSSAPNLPLTDFRITPDLRLGRGGEVEKFNDNVAAIQTLKQIEAEKRRATPAEQEVLARYVGWGGLANAFPDPLTGEFKTGWGERGATLRQLLTEKEHRLASRSTLDSHYTSEIVVNAMWQAVRRLGYRGGLALETSMGIGNFLGLIPSQLHDNTRFIGVEYDSLTARIAALLYPNATVLNSGFQSVPLADNAFDLSIGNPPFGSQSLTFQFKPDINRFSIHNQFFLASIDAVKPGGLQVQVVSRYLLDAVDSGARTELAKKAKLLAAIRLPDSAFKENARTEVVTDILFLQKLTPSEQQEMTEAIEAWQSKPAKQAEAEFERQRKAALVPDWVSTGKISDPLGGEAMTVNRYFVAHPDMILGTLERSGSMAHGKDITVRLDKSDALENRLSEAIQRLPEDVVAISDDVIAKAIERHQSMSDALRVALSGKEEGHIAFNESGELYQVIERETPEGEFELTRRLLTESSPWSASLMMDKDGKWYRLEVATDDDGKPQKRVINGKASKLNVFTRKTYENEAAVPAALRLGKNKLARLNLLISLRDLLKEQLSLEAEDAPVAHIEANRQLLNDAYQRFTQAHGFINEPSNAALISNMPDGALVFALEFDYRPEVSQAKAKLTGEAVRAAEAAPAPIMSGRVIRKYVPPSVAQTESDALAISLAEHGQVDLQRMAELLGKTPEALQQTLLDAEQPIVFLDPEHGKLVTRSDYLSGQVKRKLNAAKLAGLTKNVEALEKVQPEAWGSENITPLLGSVWIPSSTYEAFLKHLNVEAKVTFSRLTNTFNVLAKSGQLAGEWSTRRVSAADIVDHILNSRAIKVMDHDKDSSWINHEETALAQLKAKEISNEFNEWVFNDADRRHELVELFNEKFNNRVVRQHDGTHLMLPGKVPDEVIKMRRHQKNAIWRGISERFMLLDHAVGAGKTFTAIARAMERRRMGLSKKPMIVVPNHMVEQFTSDTYRLYPGAKVLAAGKKDFEKARRRKLFAKIATGDFDLVIVPHSSFMFIGIAPETEARYVNQALQEAEQAIQDAQEAADDEGYTGFKKPFGVKQAERLRDTLVAKLERIKGTANKDRLLTFEQMGIDDLTVDEAHEFKNLFYSSNLSKVKGMGDKSGSQKAFDLYNKVRVLRESPTGAVTFMTGTPISNSAVEMYTMMRYLAAGELSELGLEHFDAWRAQYVSADPGWEPNESGRLQEVTRLGRSWSNMRSLMELYYSFADVVSNEDIKKWYPVDNHGEEFPIPKVAGGQRQSVVVKPTAAQLDLLKQIIDGFDSLPNIEDTYERNKERLRLMDRARKVSLDVRAVDPSSRSTEEDGKLEQVSRQVKRLYDKWQADRGTQLIFLDRSVPKSKGDDKLVMQYDQLLAEQTAALAADDEEKLRQLSEKLEKFDADEMASLRSAQSGGWTAYQQIKDNLVRLGIPANEIRFVQEANSDEQKQALFDAVKSGQVRVLIGSTPRMGAGTNVQDLLVGLHHVDVTWKPSDIEQREGRIIRQGNKLLKKYGPNKFEVEILAYATERTIDAKMWNLNATKLEMINAIRQYDGSFNMEFDDSDSVSMAELSALASGDPMLLERVKLESEIANLELQKKQHWRKVVGQRDAIELMQRDIRHLPGLIATLEQDRATLQAIADQVQARAEVRQIDVDGQTYRSKADALKAALASKEHQQGGDDNAKFSVLVNGKRKQSISGIDDEIQRVLGDKQAFEVNLGGEVFVAKTDAARWLSQEATKASQDLKRGESITVEVGHLGGYVLEASFERSTFLDSYQTSLALLRKDGSVLASGETNRLQAYSTSGMRAAFESLDKDMQADAKQRLADKYASKLAAARAELPGLQAKDIGSFPLQAELDAKKNRLETVIKGLANGVNVEQDGETSPESTQDSGESEAVYSSDGNQAELDEKDWLSVSTIFDIVNELLQPFPVDIPVFVHDRLSVLMPDAEVQGRVYGVTRGGQIHLFRSGLASRRDVVVTLWHELFHYGLRRFLTQEQYTQILGEIYHSDKYIQYRAKAWMRTNEARDLLRNGASLEYVRARGTDEALAEFAEVLKTSQDGFKNNSLRSKVTRAIRTWVAKVADFFGFHEAAKVWRAYAPQEASRQLVIDTFDKLARNEPLTDEKFAFSAIEPAFKAGDEQKHFPNVVIAGALGTLAKHPDYVTAKAGDLQAAVRVVDDLINQAYVDSVAELVGKKKPLIAPIQAPESSGRNRIPKAAALILGKALNLSVDHSLFQDTASKRTQNNGLERIFNRPKFRGPVQQGQDYLILDDTLTQGGTIYALKRYIEDNGGRVIGATVLSGKQYSAKIGLEPSTLEALRERFGHLEQQFEKRTGYSFDGLTQSEARYLASLKDDSAFRAAVATESNLDRGIPAAGESTAGTGSPRFSTTGQRLGEGVDTGGVRGHERGLPSGRGAIRAMVRGEHSSGRSAIPTSQKGRDSLRLEAEQVAAFASKISLSWKNAPQIEIVQSVGELPFVAPDDARGAYFQGKVYLVADHLRDEADTQFTLFHEVLGHAGLRRVLGAEVNTALIALAKNNKRLAAAAKEWRELHPGQAELGSQVDFIARSIEEVLADMAGLGVEIAGWQRFAARLQALLRKVGLDQIANWLENASQAETLNLLHQAKQAVVESNKRAFANLSEAGKALYNSDGTLPETVLREISEIGDAFRYKRSSGMTVEAIAKDVDPLIEVRQVNSIPGETRYILTLPDDNRTTARISVRPYNRYGNSLYAFELNADNEMEGQITERPGWNAEVAEGKDDVWIDVSLLTEGAGYGAKIYHIAANYAFNTGRVFIGDPAGISHVAMQRRPEHMLSSALKFGTTEHIAPHPYQVRGNKKNGIAPLPWDYADPVANVLNLINVTVQNIENAGGIGGITYDQATRGFIADGGTRLVREDLYGLAKAGLARTASAGGDTLARFAFTSALLQSRPTGPAGRDALGLLVRLREQLSDYVSAANKAEDGDQSGHQAQGNARNRPLFYSSGAVGGLTQNLAGVVLPSGHTVGDYISQSDGQLSWWDKTVGTMYNLAQKNRHFARVFDAVQKLISDTSLYAAEAANHAPTLLPRLEQFSDMLKKPLATDDMKVLNAAVFEGTLNFTRNNQGEVVEAEQASDAGLVWTDAELRERYGANEHQINLYREFRAAADASLDQLGASQLLRVGGKEADAYQEKIMAMASLDDAADYLIARFTDYKDIQPERSAYFDARIDDFMAIRDRVQSLQAKGYAPLMRYGKHTVDVTSPTGERLFFSLYESSSDAAKALRELQLEYPEAKVRRGTVSTLEHKLMDGVTPETLAIFGELLGLNADGNQESDRVFQEYLRSVINNNSALKRLIHRKGVAGFDANAVRALASFLTSNARVTASNLNSAEIKNAIDSIPPGQGEVKDAAMQMLEHVQNPSTAANKLGGLMFAQYLGGSIASAAVNLTQPLMMTFPYLSQWGGAAKAASRMMQALNDLRAGTTGDAELDQAIRLAEERGVISPQEVFHLQAQASGRALLQSGDGTTVGDAKAKANNALQKFYLAWGMLFSTAESINRKLTFIAAYRTALDEGMDNPEKFAVDAIAETQGIYNAGNRPKWARTMVGSIAMTFKQFSIQYVELLMRMAKNGEQGKMAALLMLGVLLVMSGLDGLPFEQDVEDLIDGALQRMGYNFSSKRAKEQFLINTLGRSGADVVLKGLSGLPGMPIDVAGRFGLGNLIPGTGLLTNKANHTNDVLELFGAPGDFAKRSYSAASKVASGKVVDGVTDLLPGSMRNVEKGIDMLDKGAYRDERGYKVIDTTPFEALMKMIGFQPNSVARVQNAKMQAMDLIAQTKAASSAIQEHWAQGLASQDVEKVAEARAMRDAWNSRNPDTPVKVNLAGVIKRVRELRMDARERVMMAAPKVVKRAVEAELGS